jgi:hypothetical protein
VLVGGAMVSYSVEKTLDEVQKNLNQGKKIEPIDNHYFQIKDSDPSSWDEVSNLCESVNGKLTWQDGLKTCRS